MTRELRQLTVPEGVAGERIDSALTRFLGLSRTAIVKLLDDGEILLVQKVTVIGLQAVMVLHAGTANQRIGLARRTADQDPGLRLT